MKIKNIIGASALACFSYIGQAQVHLLHNSITPVAGLGTYIVNGSTFHGSETILSGYMAGGSAQGVILQKIDANGTVTLTKELATTYPLQGGAITSTATGFALVGRPAQSQYKDLLILTNEAFEPTNVYQLSLTTGEFRIKSICFHAAANAYYATGNGLTNAPLSLHKISATGNVVWSKTLLQGGIANASILQPTADGSLLLAGNVDLSSSGDENMFVAKLDTTGNILWSKVADIAKFEAITGIVELDNAEGFMLIGNFKTGLAALNQAFLWSIAANGNPKTMLHLGGDSKFGNAISKLEYNHVAIGMSGTFSGTFGSRMIVAVANPMGEIQWSKRTASNTLNSGINAMHTDNNGAVRLSYYLGYSVIDPRFNGFNCQFETYIPDTTTLIPTYTTLIGSPFNYPVNSQTITLNQTDLVFTNNTVCDTVVNTLATAVEEAFEVQKTTVYPNPFSDKITLELTALDSNQKQEYRLYSIVGNCVSQGKLESNVFELETDQLSSGVYFLQIIQHEKVLQAFKICKQ